MKRHNASYNFIHRGETYTVEWEEDNMVLKLSFLNPKYELLKVRNIPLLGPIDESQLKSIVKDYWKSFVKNELKDSVG